MQRYNILKYVRYQIGPTVDILNDNYWATLAAGEEEGAEALELMEEPGVSNPFIIEDTPSHPASETGAMVVVGKDVKGESELAQGKTL